MNESEIKQEPPKAFQVTFQFRAYTSRQGYAQLDDVLRRQCWLYNQALEMRKNAYEIGGVTVTYQDQAKWLTGMRSTHRGTMDTIARRVQCGTLLRLERAYGGFFRRIATKQKAGHPRFKPAQRWQTITVDSPQYERSWLHFEPDRRQPVITLTVKGLPPLEMKVSRERCIQLQQLQSNKKWTGLRITRKGRRATVNLTFATDKDPMPTTGQVLGMNRGIVRQATIYAGSPETLDGRQAGQWRQGDSCWWGSHFGTVLRTISENHALIDLENAGQMVVPIDSLTTPHAKAQNQPTVTVVKPVKNDEKKQRRLQRKIARAARGSNSRRKKVATLSNFHEKQRIRQRNDAHRLTSQIIQNFDVVGMEKWDIPKMTRSARGTVEEPGKGVARKSQFNREILVQRWGQMQTQLAYKAEWAGRQLIAVPADYITQTCSRCGQRNPGPYEQRMYTCRHCGYEIDQDETAAINILRRALGPAGAELKPRCAASIDNP